MLNVLKKKKKTRSTRDSGGFLLQIIDCGNGIMGVGICPNSLNYTHQIYVVLCLSIIP